MAHGRWNSEWPCHPLPAFGGRFVLALALALAPGTFGEDQPDPGRPELQALQAIPNQIVSSLLVRDSTVKQLRSDLDDDVELANVEVALAAKPDLEIAGTRWPDPRSSGQSTASATMSGNSSARRRKRRSSIVSS